MRDAPTKAPTHRGFKVRCPKEGARRGRRDALVDFERFCKAGCPFYQGKDLGGVLCSFVPSRDASAATRSNAAGTAL